jgi:simple sugar transport system substrate-binding protein
MVSSLARVSLIALTWLGVCGVHAQAQGQPADDRHVLMVTHGTATDPFWATVKGGAEQAAKDAGAQVVYRAPETFDLGAMAALVSAAIEEKPAGLIVSIPNADVLAGPIRAAVDAGIPVISINSGYDVSKSMGALLHVGQSEYEAGRVAGEAMRDLDASKALCLNHELGNVALDLRCKGFIDGFGGSVEVLSVESGPESTGDAVAERLAADADIDAVLALNATMAGEPAIAAADALADGRVVHVATFDITDPVLNAVADGKASFAVDQQPFLQGYLPVHYLILLQRHGVVPVSNVSTGPKLVTAEEAARRLGRPAAVTPAEDSANPATPGVQLELRGG